ncbi:MAG TPA: FUSC family protein [Brevibacillus sp.]|nr:FUSC family protein [Brevibacillus sp.]
MDPGHDHRAIQRSIGTIIGVIIATLILWVKPEGIVIVIAIFLFTALTELAIVFNYGIAASFQLASPFHGKNNLK